MDTLAQLGANALSLPGVDEPMAPARYVTTILAGGREEGWDFERSWSAAINRLQPAVSEGAIDVAEAAKLRRERAFLEEQRDLFAAAFERRSATGRDESTSVVGRWERLGW